MSRLKENAIRKSRGQVKLVEEVEGIEEGNLKELEQKIHKVHSSRLKRQRRPFPACFLSR
jgi:hypothetical protein